jgi:hypothetical protein
MPTRLWRKKSIWQGWVGSLTLMLMIIYSPVVALPDLIVDNGETYTMSTDITNNNVTVGQNSTGTLLQGGLHQHGE